MKKIMLYSASLLLVGAMIAMATDADLTQRQVRDPKKLAKILDARTVVQTDTNVTTTVTGYTPSKAGQILIGGAGTGTNAVWISKGTTTNDWVQVAP